MTSVQWTTSHLKNVIWNGIEAGTSIQRPGSISQNVIAVFIGCRTMAFPAAPCVIRKEGREREKFYIYSDVTHTHTHPAGAGSTLKGNRKKKADTDDGQKAKTAQVGKGRNGPPEPTYAAKRTWQKQSTHLNPTTHYGKAQGERN